MEPWLGEEEKQALIEYLDSGGWLTEHTKTEEFETMVANYVGSKYALAVSNGTVSLSVAMMALGLGREDEVIVPDFTMIASATSVILAGARPVLVDVDPSTLCLDLEKVEAAITSRTKAVVLVSLNGRCPDMKKILTLVKNHGLLLIEDAAQSLGSRYKNKHLGTFANVGSFSFSPPKIITTGQGGILVTNDKELYHKMLLVKNFGRQMKGVDEYVILGYNFKFTDLQAVIGIEQMKKLPSRVKRKKEMYKLYRDLLKGVTQIDFIETDLSDTTPWFIDILIEDRNDLASFLNRQNIDTRPFYPAIHTQKPFSHVKGDFKNSEAVSKRGLWLPSSSFLTDDEIMRICAEIRAYFK